MRALDQLGRSEKSTPPPVETFGGVPAYVQRGPCYWNRTVLHIAFLAIRVASIGFDPTLAPVPVKITPDARAPLVLPWLEQVSSMLPIHS